MIKIGEKIIIKNNNYLYYGLRIGDSAIIHDITPHGSVHILCGTYKLEILGEDFIAHNSLKVSTERRGEVALELLKALVASDYTDNGDHMIKDAFDLADAFIAKLEGHSNDKID